MRENDTLNIGGALKALAQATFCHRRKLSIWKFRKGGIISAENHLFGLYGVMIFCRLCRECECTRHLSLDEEVLAIRIQTHRRALVELNFALLFCFRLFDQSKEPERSVFLRSIDLSIEGMVSRERREREP